MVKIGILQRIRARQKARRDARSGGEVTSTRVAPSTVTSTGGAIVGDTPSGYISKIPSTSPGTTSITYSRGGGGSSSRGSTSSRTITSPSGKVVTQTPTQAQTGTSTVSITSQQAAFAKQRNLQVNPQVNPMGNQGTQFNQPSKLNIPIQQPGTIYQVQTGETEWKDKFGRRIPIFETYTNPYDSYSARPSTQEEKDYLNKRISSDALREVILSPKPTDSQIDYGITKGKFMQIEASNQFIDPVGTEKFLVDVGGFEEKGAKLTANIAYGAIGTPSKVLKTGASFVVGAGAGATLKGIGYGLSQIPTVGPYASTGFKIGSYGAGVGLTGLYAGNVATQIYAASTPEEKYQIIGRTGADLGAGIYGFGIGSKGFDVALGKWNTAGKTQIPTEQIVMEGALKGEVYPSKPIGEHWNEFKLNSQRLVLKLEGYSGEGTFISSSKVQTLPVKVDPVLYHSTGSQFWKGNSFKVSGDVGDSEFKGLFGGSGISPTFLRFKGGSSSNVRLIPSLSDFTASSNPASAAIIPKNIIKGINAPVGEAFVPGAAGFQKPEIQAILSVGSEPKLVSSNLYYKWKDVNIPLDVFTTKGTIGGEAITGKGFNPSSYGSYNPSTLYNPLASVSLLGSGSSGSKVSTSSSINIPSYSINIPSSSIVSSVSGSSGGSSSASITPSYSSGGSSSASITPSYSSGGSSSASITPSYSSGGSSSKSITPSYPSGGSSSKSITPSYPSITPSYSSGGSSSKSITPSYSSITPSYPSGGSSSKSSSYKMFQKPYMPKKQIPAMPKLRSLKPRKSRGGSFAVLGRRFGKFKVVGYGKTPQQAVLFGKNWASRTLGTSFTIKGVTGKKSLKGFYTKKGKEGTVYTEKIGRRLKKGGSEVKEIQLYPKRRTKTKGGKK